jgi:hypothetical protein
MMSCFEPMCLPESYYRVTDGRKANQLNKCVLRECNENFDWRADQTSRKLEENVNMNLRLI